MDYRALGEFRLTLNWLLWLLFAYFVLPILVVLFVPIVLHRTSPLTRKSVSILVLGDLGHLPRMCYHAMSFSRLGYAVNLCGYIESAPPPGVIDDINIDVFPVKVIHNTRNWPYLVFAVTKALRQVSALFMLLLDLRGSEYYMIQNPPSFPLLAVLALFIKLCSPKARIVIDWHNLHSLIINLRYKNTRHPLVRAFAAYERYFSKFAWLNVAVTDKMRDFLVHDFGLPKASVVTLHDRPGPLFEPLSEAEKTNLLQKHPLFEGIDSSYKILVTATSFTPDEDFGILVSALRSLHKSRSDKLLVVVTGKGPLKAQFLESVQEAQLEPKILVRSAWLEPEEYPKILGCADLSVSLHTSLSGLDLPMKILDFFGVAVPVVTPRFAAIDELVKHGVNGLICEPEQLAEAVTEALDEKLTTLKAGALVESGNRWKLNWTETLAPLF